MSRPLTFAILTGGPDAAHELRAALETDRRVRVVAESHDFEDIYAAAVHRRPSGVIITIGAHGDPALHLCRQINAVCPETVIICAMQNSSPDLILDCLRSGAREFLRLPIDAEEVRTALDRTAELRAGNSQAARKHGRVIALFSNKGGCGVSFIAANLAISLGAPTCLVDLNLQTGGLEILLGLKPKFSVVDVVKNRARLDDQLIGSFLTSCSDKLSLLAAPDDPEAAEDMRPEYVAEVIDLLRERYEYVVLDLPHTFDPITIAALDQADDILLVLTLDILASRAAQRSLVIFNRLGYSRQKVRVVLNRWNKQSDLELRYIERFLGERVTCFITDDYRTVVNSVNLGKPLVTTAGNTPIVIELKRLADIYGASAKESEPEPRKNILSSFLRNQSGSGESQGVVSSFASSITAAFRRQSGSMESQGDDAK